MSNTESSAGRKRINFNVMLNGYRGLCALLIFVYHVFNSRLVAWPLDTPLQRSVDFLWTSFRYGVEMFFMISGFVILGSLLRHDSVSGFLKDRFVRIFSVWIPVLLVLTLIGSITKLEMFAGLAPWQTLELFAANLVLLPPLLPLPVIHTGSWSLTYEWVFYLAASGALLLWRSTPRRTWQLAIWSLLICTFICLFPRALFFVTGAWVFTRQEWLLRHKRWLVHPLASLLLFLVAWRLTGADHAQFGETIFDWLQDGRWLAAVVALLASLHMFACVTLNEKGQFAFLKSATFQFLGNISYSFYLWHVLVMAFVKRLVLPRLPSEFMGQLPWMTLLLFSAVSLLVVLPVSWLSWRLLEQRFANVMRGWLSHRWTTSPASARDGIGIANDATPIRTATLATIQGAPKSASLRCLWISRNIPFPMDEGAKVYSAKLALALVHSGVSVRFCGFGDVAMVPESAAAIEWLAVPNERYGKYRALFSHLPVAAASDATYAYQQLVKHQLELHANEPQWDVIVLDGYGTGWALDRCKAYCHKHRHAAPVLVHVSHNHEEALWLAMASKATGSLPSRLVWWLNYRKVRTLERRLVRSVDLLTTITDEDRHSLGGTLGEARTLCLTPGYTGSVMEQRRLDAQTPRRVIIVGSFRWVVKQENLVRFVELADPIFKRNNIALDVVGEVPNELLSKLNQFCQATSFHGFVDDIAPLFAQARIAVVPETIGGGFKLKFLDYLFGRVPVATLSQAAAGLPIEIQQQMLMSNDLLQLVEQIVGHIDHVEALNAMQEHAFTLAKTRFKWESRGEQLHAAVVRLRNRAQHQVQPSSAIEVQLGESLHG